MFRYNDPLEAADMRKSMTEKSRKVHLYIWHFLYYNINNKNNM